MGWQLVPTGIGWKEFSRTVDQGSFECSNPKCKGKRDPQQTYDVKSGRNWFTILFIPIIPLNSTGSWAKCSSCKTVHPLSALQRSSSPAPTPPTPPSVAVASSPQQHAAVAPSSHAGPVATPSSARDPRAAETGNAAQVLSGVPVAAWLLFAGLLVYLIVDLDQEYVLGGLDATWRKLVVIAGLIAAAVFGLTRRVLASSAAVASALFVLLRGAQVLVSGRGDWHQVPLFLADVALVAGTFRCVAGFGESTDRDGLPNLQPAVIGSAAIAGLFGLLMFRNWLSDSFRYVFLETAHWVGLAVVLAVLILKLGTRPAALTATLAGAYAAFSLPSQDQFGGVRHVTMLALLALAGIGGFLFVKLGENTAPGTATAPGVSPAVAAESAATPAQPPLPLADPPVSNVDAASTPPADPPKVVASVPIATPPPAPTEVAPSPPQLDIAWLDGRPMDVDNVVVIGRNPSASEADGPHVLVPLPGNGLISRTHLAVGRAADGSLWVEDRHSTNGVIVNGDTLAPGVRIPLRAGSEIQFGDQILKVSTRTQPGHDSADASSEAPEQHSVPPIAAVAPAAPAVPDDEVAVPPASTVIVTPPVVEREGAATEIPGQAVNEVESPAAAVERGGALPDDESIEQMSDDEYGSAMRAIADQIEAVVRAWPEQFTDLGNGRDTVNWAKWCFDEYAPVALQGQVLEGNGIKMNLPPVFRPGDEIRFVVPAFFDDDPTDVPVGRGASKVKFNGKRRNGVLFVTNRSFAISHDAGNYVFAHRTSLAQVEQLNPVKFAMSLMSATSAGPGYELIARTEDGEIDRLLFRVALSPAGGDDKFERTLRSHLGLTASG